MSVGLYGLPLSSSPKTAKCPYNTALVPSPEFASKLATSYVLPSELVALRLRPLLDHFMPSVIILLVVKVPSVMYTLLLEYV